MSDADNLVWGPINNAMLIVAGSSTFQTLVGHAADAAAALGHVYSPLIAKAEIKTARPCALIDFGNAFEDRRNSSDSAKASGSVLFQLDIDFPSDVTLGLVDPTETVRANAGHKYYSKLLGDIFTEVKDLSNGGGGYLNIDSIRQSLAPERAMIEDRTDWGDFYNSVYEWFWS